MAALASRLFAAPLWLLRTTIHNNVFGALHPQITTTNDHPIEHNSFRHNVKERLLDTGAAVLTTTANTLLNIANRRPAKRTNDVIDDSHDTPLARPAKRRHLSPSLSETASAVLYSNKRKLDGGFYQSDLRLPQHKRHDAYVDGLPPRLRMLHNQRTMLKHSSSLSRADEKTTAHKNGSINRAPLLKDSPRDAYEERALAREKALEAAQEKALKERKLREEEEAAERERKRKKKQRLIEKSRKEQLHADHKDFLEAKKAYEAEVEKILQQVNRLDFTSREAEPDAARPKRDPFGRLLPPREAEKTRLITKLSDEWSNKIKNTLAIRPENTVVGKSKEGTELSRKDIGRILPGEPWLNDEVVNAFYANLCARLNEKDGYEKGPNKVPRWVAYSTAWYNNVTEKGVNSIVGWSRRKGIKNDKLLQTERIFFPTNTGVHWTLLTISGKHKTIEYLDSLNTAGYKQQRNINMAKAWLKMELGAQYVEDEWKVLPTVSGQQSNSNDCGVFACFNGWALVSGSGDPGADIGSSEMPNARRLLAAILLNGGFEGDFDV